MGFPLLGQSFGLFGFFLGEVVKFVGVGGEVVEFPIGLFPIISI